MEIEANVCLSIFEHHAEVNHLPFAHCFELLLLKFLENASKIKHINHHAKKYEVCPEVAYK